MAKTSAVQKNLKRIKLVKKYAKKRAALKKIINNKKLELSERFDAQLKLNKLPKNSAKIRIRNRNRTHHFHIQSSHFAIHHTFIHICITHLIHYVLLT